MPELTKQQQAEVKKEVQSQVAEIERKIESETKKRVQKHLSKHLLKKTALFGSEFKKQTSTAIIAAFGFIVALVWRDLIQKVIQEYTKTTLLETHPYISLLYTAIVITLISVIGIALVTRWAKKPEKPPVPQA